MTTIGEASIYAPNTYFTDFTARKLSNARFRGIGSSPANPAITTNIDGVPQLNTNSSSIELLDVSQVEFVRGPQSALFGRNTLGGLVNVSSVRPSLTKWTGSAVVPFGNFGAVDVRGERVRPGGEEGARSASRSVTRERDGFTTNDVTGRDVDFRDGMFGKAQLLLTPTANWEARLIYTRRARPRRRLCAERSRRPARQPAPRGARLRGAHQPRRQRGDVPGPPRGAEVHASARRPACVRWKTDDSRTWTTRRLPLITRSNNEKDVQFTQEFAVRVARRPAPVKLSDAASLKWQAGVFLFSQNYDQAAVNNFAPFVLSPFISFPVAQHSPEAALDDTGVGVYGSGTIHVRQAGRHAGRPFRSREPQGGPPDVFRRAAIDGRAGRGRHREVVLQRLAAGGRLVPRAARRDGVLLGHRRLQGRRLQPGVARRAARSYDEEKTWNCRRRA